MNSQIKTPIGMPSELNFTLPSSMVSSRKYELRISPYGQQNFTTAGQTAKFVVPKTDRTLFNFGGTGYMFGTVEFTHAGAKGTDLSCLISSWYATLQRQVLRSGGYVLETIENVGELVNLITSSTINPASRIALEGSMGFSPNTVATNAGVRIFTDTLATDIGGVPGTELKFTFAIPIIGVLNSTKFYPGFINDLELELTFADKSKYIVDKTNNTVSSVTFSNLELVVECLELTPESYNVLINQNPEQFVIKTQTYSYGSGSIEAGKGAGTVDIPFNIKVQSLKQLYWYSQPVDAAEKTYAGVNPNLENWNFLVNGMSYPQRPIQAKYPAEQFLQNQKSFGSVYSTDHSGNGNRNTFNICSSITGYDYHRAYNSNASLFTAIDGTHRSNKWYAVLDLETINSNKESLYTGISTSSTNSQIRLNIKAPLAAVSHNVHFFSCQDVLISMNMITGITQVIV